MSKKMNILIVDDDPMIVKTLKDIFHIKGYNAYVAESGLEALEELKSRSFDCILSDIKMPDINGLDLYKKIRKRGFTLPVLLMTAYSTDKLIKEGLEEGVISVLTKPVDIDLLLRFFPTLSRELSVAIIDDDMDFCEALGKMLQKQNFKVIEITQYRNIMKNLNENIDVILLDIKLDESNGLSVLKEIREHYPRTPVVFMTAYGEEFREEIERELGFNVYACFYKPFQAEQLFSLFNLFRHKKLREFLSFFKRKKS